MYSLQALFFENFPFGIVMWFVPARNITFVGSLQSSNARIFKGILLSATMVGPGWHLCHPRATAETWKMNHTCVTECFLKQSKKLDILKNCSMLILYLQGVYWEKILLHDTLVSLVCFILLNKRIWKIMNKEWSRI